MAKIKQGKKDLDSYTIRGTTKVVRGTRLAPSLLARRLRREI
jgi:hypothetical protein